MPFSTENKLVDRVGPSGGVRMLDKWKFCWIVDKAKVNGTEEFEDYEPSLTKEQRAERDKVLAHFEEAFRQIQTE